MLGQAISTVSDMLKAVYSHPMHFDAADIARSRSHAGDGTRLRRVMTRLLQGATCLLSGPVQGLIVLGAGMGVSAAALCCS